MRKNPLTLPLVSNNTDGRRQGQKFAEINRNMQARFSEQDEKFAEINRKLT